MSRAAPAPAAATDPAEALVRGALKAGVEACVYLPDSCLTRTLRAFQRAGVAAIPCAREDEGVAIAVGLHLGGKIAICLMEASGVGYSGLILARAQVQRTPVVIVASHSRGGGEPNDYHGATIVAGEGIFGGLGIPYEVARDAAWLESGIFRILETAKGQLTSFGLLVPPHVMAEGEP
jgi:sulfopyruvate decarboxylase subunit alpha